MLLRNYYALLVSRTINSNNLSEVVPDDIIAPSVSRTVGGSYARYSSSYSRYFYNLVSPTNIATSYINTTGSNGEGTLYLILGVGTDVVNFNDYKLTLTSNWSGKFVTVNTTYDNNTHIYTSVSKFVITNNSSTASITFSEFGIYMAGAYSSEDNSGRLILRELLGENTFTLEPLESANFELTIKYTIPSILQ